MKRLIACSLSAALFFTCNLATSATLPMRLGDAARPLAYAVDLRVDPDRSRHSGSVTIELELKAPLQRLRLHAKQLRISTVSLQPEQGAALKGRAAKADDDSAYLHFNKPVPAGRARLTLAFEGQISDKDVFGLFRQREGGRWYAFTQLEDVGARRAFPLFDEPGWKVPWTLALTVPSGQQAFANMPVLRESPAGAGWKRLEFKPSPPMPSYLLAFAVGPFDVLQGVPTGTLPLRYLTPLGKAQDATFAAAVTPAIVERLQAYFGLPYPYDKLDSLVIPLTDWFSAMENAGLITYASRIMLARPGEESRTLQRDYVSTAAHEIAHQWFGNYVTMGWWSDLWLNESFASWMGDKITAEVRPDWRWEVSGQHARRSAMLGDRLASARRVRQPVDTPQDLGTAFDEITYSKGQAVLAMFEGWLGPDRMQAGVRRYMARHAWGSASGDDFMAALADGDQELVRAFSSFIDQPGIPKLNLRLLCESGSVRLQVEQSRYRPLGTPDTAPALWQVPLVLRTPAGTTRHWLKTASTTLTLPDRDCPAWLQPNPGGQGYYRAHLTPELPRGELSINEWLALLDDQMALAQSGDVPLNQVLALATELARDPRREIAEAVTRLLVELRPLVQPQQQAAFARLWQQRYGALARELGWAVQAGDSEDRRLLRELLLPLLADLGRDIALRAQARERVKAWLAGPQATELDPGLRGALLQSAAIEGDAALFDAMLKRALQTPQRQVREDLLQALGWFESPVLAERARGLMLDPRLDIRELAPELLRRQSRQASSAPVIRAFVMKHAEAMRKRMPSQAPAYWPEQLGQGCSAAEADDLQRLFGSRANAYAAGPGTLAKALERLRLCAAFREAQGAALDAYLQFLP
ncbi:MAG: M1 family metallopeptidase [Burkholderiaceae bacterium]|nr:M1 family metallopeptidase [Burkholderiaceae bacterium]